jgi:hypothetical protein
MRGKECVVWLVGGGVGGGAEMDRTFDLGARRT